MYNARPFRKARAVNSSSANYPTLAAEIDLALSDVGTAAGRCIIPLVNPGGNGKVPKKIEIWPYGLGANNDAFSFRLIGWRRFLPIASTEPRSLWVPGIVADCACVMGNFTGLAGFPVLNTEFFCDTITITAALQPTKLGNSTLLDGFTKAFSPANDTPARVQVYLEAFEAFELQWDQTTNTPSMNALYTFIDCD